jgi:hypothetical protein
MSVDKTASKAATDQPMQIVSALPNEENTIITVTWAAVDYGKNAQAYNVAIICVGQSTDNFLQTDLAATSLECPYTMQEGLSYRTFVVPINKGNPVSKWQSPTVSIPYPPVG